MLLFELFGTEEHPSYKGLSIDNLNRQYDFLQSVINAAVSINRPHVSSALIKALNVHAIACLHVNAGQYRPCAVKVGEYQPPDHYRIPDLMEDFINDLNYLWHTEDGVVLATWALWRLCYIHPFINGNGRTARALCYYIVCAKAGGLLAGQTILPELIRRNRGEYVGLLKAIDARLHGGQGLHLGELHAFIQRLLQEQLASAHVHHAAPPADPAAGVAMPAAAAAAPEEK